MRTRSTIKVFENGMVVVNIYQQFDGYPTGVGAVLKGMLSQAKIVNGFGDGMQNPTHFNGMGCLAAYLVGQLKKGIGGTYIVPIHHDEDYNYHLKQVKEGLHLEVIKLGNLIWDGSLKDFDPEKVESIE